MSRIQPNAVLSAGEADRVSALARTSVEIIERYQAASGAYPASPNFPVYDYCWFRDGGFTADAMSRVGRTESAERFFRWCDRVLVSRSAAIESLVERRLAGAPINSRELLPCRYRMDGTDGVEDWWEFQLDGYGTWLWALGEHAVRHDLQLDDYAESIRLTAIYLSAFWSEPCYDWWEENPTQLHTSTLAAVYGGMTAAIDSRTLAPALRNDVARAACDVRTRVLDRGVREGHLVKWLGGDALDASLICCATPFGLVSADDAVMRRTIAALTRELAHGGVHRYAADTYFGGGEWLLLASFLGWHYAMVGQQDKAREQLLWVAGQAGADGSLPEQVAGHLLAPERYQEWVDRWGPVADPLLWSHAMFLTLASVLGVVGDGPLG